MSEETYASVKKRGERVRTSRDVGGETRVQQSPRDKVNINTIVARYIAQNKVNTLINDDRIYGNVDLGVELQTALEQIEAQQTRFMELDANIRAVADNDLPTFLELLSDKEGVEALEAAGLRIEGRDDPANTPFSFLKAEGNAAVSESAPEAPSEPVEAQ